MVGLLRMVARVSAKGRDGHTGAFIWGRGSYPVQSLPLRLWLFSDGLFVVDTLPPYRRLVGSRIEGDCRPAARRGPRGVGSSDAPRQSVHRDAADPSLPAHPGGPA